MNQRSDLDRILNLWLADGPTTMPDRVVDVVAGRIARQRQRRAWRLPWRPEMNRYLKIAAGLAAVLVLAIVAWQLLPGRGDVGGQPTSPPSPAAQATPVTWPWWVAQEDRGRDCGSGPRDGGLPPGCLRELSAGTHQSVGLVPPMQFTVPAGWINTGAYEQWFVLIPDTPVTRAGNQQQILVSPDWQNLESSCEDTTAASSPPSAADLIRAIEGADGVDVGAPAPIAVGSLSGQIVDVQLSAGWTATCPEDATTPAAPVFGFRVRDGERYRFIALDAPGGRNILVVLSAADEAAFDLLASDGMSIVESFAFEFGPAAT